MTGILIFILGTIVGAVAVPLCPPLFRLAEKIRGKLKLRPHIDG